MALRVLSMGPLLLLCNLLVIANAGSVDSQIAGIVQQLRDAVTMDQCESLTSSPAFESSSRRRLEETDAKSQCLTTQVVDMDDRLTQLEDGQGTTWQRWTRFGSKYGVGTSGEVESAGWNTENVAAHRNKKKYQGNSHCEDGLCLDFWCSSECVAKIWRTIPENINRIRVKAGNEHSANCENYIVVSDSGGAEKNKVTLRKSGDSYDNAEVHFFDVEEGDTLTFQEGSEGQAGCIMDLWWVDFATTDAALDGSDELARALARIRELEAQVEILHLADVPWERWTTFGSQYGVGNSDQVAAAGWTPDSVASSRNKEHYQNNSECEDGACFDFWCSSGCVATISRVVPKGIQKLRVKAANEHSGSCQNSIILTSADGVEKKKVTLKKENEQYYNAEIHIFEVAEGDTLTFQEGTTSAGCIFDLWWVDRQ